MKQVWYCAGVMKPRGATDHYRQTPEYTLMGDALNKIVRDRDEAPVTLPRWGATETARAPSRESARSRAND